MLPRNSQNHGPLHVNSPAAAALRRPGSCRARCAARYHSRPTTPTPAVGIAAASTGLKTSISKARRSTCQSARSCAKLAAEQRRRRKATRRNQAIIRERSPLAIAASSCGSDISGRADGCVLPDAGGSASIGIAEEGPATGAAGLSAASTTAGSAAMPFFGTPRHAATLLEGLPGDAG